MLDTEITNRRVKHIDCLYSCLPFLFEAKDEVDPAGEMFADVVWLQGLAMYENEETSTVSRPCRQVDIPYMFATLALAKVKP